jgi:hypothetical protein
MATAGAGLVMHALPCHTGSAVQREMPVPNPPALMLPSSRAPELPLLLQAGYHPTPPDPFSLQHIPAAESPPPRLV